MPFRIPTSIGSHVQAQGHEDSGREWLSCPSEVPLQGPPGGPHVPFPWQKQAIPAEFHVCGTQGAIMPLSQVTEAEVGGEFL